MSKKVADICSYIKANTMITDGMIAGVSSSKLTGTVTDSQIAGVSSSKLTGTVTDSQIADMDASKLTGTVTDSQIADMDASKLTGTLNMGGTMTSHIIPDTNNTYDIGNAEFKIRDLYVSDSTIHMGDEATIKAEGKAIVVQDLKTGDLHLDNTQRAGNSVDGTKGSWTFQEGAEDMYLLNNVSGKKYKINLTEI